VVTGGADNDGSVLSLSLLLSLLLRPVVLVGVMVRGVVDVVVVVVVVVMAEDGFKERSSADCERKMAVVGDVLLLLVFQG
jgi:hypothetical protein